jgi:hypothetical protein
MVIPSTQFPHEIIHKGTWLCPNSQKINQIYHPLVNQGKNTPIQGVRYLTGPNCDLEHYLVQVIIKQKLVQQHKMEQIRRWNLINLVNYDF